MESNKFLILQGNGMLHKKSGEIEWLEFELLQGIPQLKHGVFLRSGGISQHQYSSLNLGLNVKDQPERVTYNRNQVQELCNLKKIIAGNLVHGIHAELLKKVDQRIGDCDVLLTDLSAVGLLTTHADCQAVLFYDPLHRAIANAHAGWKGIVGNIYGATIRAMHEAFGSNPADLLVCISPSLGPKYAEFKKYKEEFPSNLWKYQVTPFHFDLWAIARDQLEELGVMPFNIEIAHICTYCNPKDFYSYRRDHITGRNGTIIGFAQGI